jgi:hypothetical protein
VSASADDPALREGAWIFVSHSHRDLREVRRVRDALEAEGHQPLLFFLKCLDDDSEIDDLIRREIEARQFFLLCDSANARTSRWVQQEASLIKDLPGKISVNVELDGDWEAQLAAVRELSRRATIFIDYAMDALDVAVEIADGLRANDYRVFRDADDIRSGERWRQAITDALDEALDTGYVLLLLSHGALRSTEVRRTLQYAENGSSGRGTSARVVPIIARDREEIHSLIAEDPGSPMLESVEWLDFTTGQFEDNLADLMRILRD